MKWKCPIKIKQQPKHDSQNEKKKEENKEEKNFDQSCERKWKWY